MSIARRDFLRAATLGGAAAGLLSLSRKAPAQTGKFPKKVIILGFDGASPWFVEKWMDEGLLPNLAKIRSMGAYSRILTANPPQTPVSWATFATGMNPGKTRLYDFLRRNPQDYTPNISLVDDGWTPFALGPENAFKVAAGAFAVGGIAALVVKSLYEVMLRRQNPFELKKMFDPKLLAAVAGLGAAAGAGAFTLSKEYMPEEMPTIENGVKGQTFWQYLDERGIPTLSFRVPARFPADRHQHGRALARLGVTDVRKTMGTFTYYTTEILNPVDSGDTEMGGKVVPLYFNPRTSEARTAVYGPINELFLSDEAKKLKAAGQPYGDLLKDVTLELKLKLDGDTLSLQTPSWTISLRHGQWSKPMPFSFKFNKFIGIDGYAKFYLLETSPEVKLYLQPISFHPKTPVVAMGPVRISTPQSFAGDLYDQYGPYKTLGWAADTWALNELRIPEEVFLEDVRDFVGQYRQMMLGFLESNEPLYVHVYSFTDRIAHMFWHHIDPTHPLYKPELAARYGKVIQESYQLMDSIVGDVLKSLDDSKWLFVLSDHGFQPFNYSFNTNTWLAKNGFIASTTGSMSDRQMKLDDLFGNGLFWPNVDWSKTKAYALGLGGIYINVAGRESKGVVQGSEYDEIRNQIIKGLESYVDPTTGQKPIFKVYRREESYTGYDPNDMPDLRFSNNPGFRGGWQSSLGGFAPDVTSVNARKWSGDHCTYEPTLTKGIFFSSRPLPGKDPALWDFFPTVLSIFGYKPSSEIDGKNLLQP